MHIHDAALTILLLLSGWFEHPRLPSSIWDTKPSTVLLGLAFPSLGHSVGNSVSLSPYNETPNISYSQSALISMCLPCFPFSKAQYERGNRRHFGRYKYAWDGLRWVLIDTVSLILNFIILCGSFCPELGYLPGCKCAQAMGAPRPLLSSIYHSHSIPLKCWLIAFTLHMRGPEE